MTARRLTPTAVALLLTSSATLRAQTPTVDIIPYLITGYRTVPTEKLSDFLSESGFEDDPLSDEPFGDKVAIGVGMDIETNRWMIEIEATTDLPKSRTRKALDVSFNSIGLQLNGGYQLLASGKFELYPILGLGLRLSSMTIEKGEADSLPGIRNNPDAVWLNSSNTELHGTAGFGVAYEIYRRDNGGSATGLNLGLRGDYSFGFTDAWSGRPGGPDMNLRGFSIWLVARIKLHKKV